MAGERRLTPGHVTGQPQSTVRSRRSFAALAGLVFVHSQGRLGLSQTERERLTHEDDRADFDEWITTIRLPDEAFDLPRAEASSLGDLVNFAIDTDNSVAEDPTEDAYYVVHDGYLYAYYPPTRGTNNFGKGVTDGEYDGSELLDEKSISLRIESNDTEDASDPSDDTSAESE